MVVRRRQEHCWPDFSWQASCWGDPWAGSFFQGREERETISRFLENEMLASMCHLRHTPWESPMSLLFPAGLRSELCVYLCPETELPICENFSQQGWQQMKLFFSICYVVRALETDWIPKCYLNLISVQAGDWCKRITEYQISKGFLSNVGEGLQRGSGKEFPFEEEHLSLVSMNFSQPVKFYCLGCMCGVLFNDGCVGLLF